MKVGIVADIHEHVGHLRAAVRVFQDSQVDKIVVLGDVFLIVHAVLDGWCAVYDTETTEFRPCFIGSLVAFPWAADRKTPFWPAWLAGDLVALQFSPCNTISPPTSKQSVASATFPRALAACFASRRR